MRCLLRQLNLIKKATRRRSMLGYMEYNFLLYLHRRKEHRNEKRKTTFNTHLL